MSSQLDEVRFDPPPAKLAWIETIAVTLLVPLIGFVLHRHDPMFITGPFPWLIVAPLLAGMRYGFLFGFVSAVLASALLALGWRLTDLPGLALPYEYCLAAMITGMLAGEFADGWLRKLGRMQILLDYRVSRQTEFARSYHLLKVSHDQLEERIAGTRYSLRNALVDLRKNLVIVGSDVLVEQNAVRILEFLEVHSDLQHAALYGVFDNRKLGERALARIGGEPSAAIADHPMLRDCLESGRLVSVRVRAFKSAERDDERDLLAVIPLIDTDQRIWGVVAVFDMPFMSFHDDNLNLIGALGASIGDFLSESTQEISSRDLSHASWFSAKLRRWSIYAKRYQMQSTLVGVGISATVHGLPRETGVESLIFEQMRGLDEGLAMSNSEGGITILVLMPLADTRGFEGYRNRMSGQINRRLGHTALTTEVVFRHRVLSDGGDPDALLTELHQECERALA